MLLSELKKKTTCLYNLFKEIVKQRLECPLRRISFLFHQYCVSNETLKTNKKKNIRFIREWNVVTLGEKKQNENKKRKQKQNTIELFFKQCSGVKFFNTLKIIKAHIFKNRTIKNLNQP